MNKPDKGYKGMAMEGIIASWYAKTTYSDLNRHQVLAQKVVKRLSAGSRVLEIAPGPGFFCIELAKLGNYNITGLDISHSFVEIAQNNSAKAGVKIDFRLGNASAMPFEAESFDFMVCQAAFKNFSQPIEAIREMYRVLVPGGTALILDMRGDASTEDINQEIAHMGVNIINQAFIKWTFQNMLIKRAYTISEMRDFIAQTPFRTAEICPEGIGFEARLARGN